MRLLCWAGWMSWAQREVAFPLVFNRALFIPLCKIVGGIEERTRIFFVLTENFSFLALLFYFMTLYCIRK